MDHKSTTLTLMHCGPLRSDAVNSHTGRKHENGNDNRQREGLHGNWVQWCAWLSCRLACGDQRRLTGSGDALEALRDDALHKSTYFTLLLFLQYTTNFCWSCADAFLSESVCLTFDSTIDSLSCSSATLFCRSLSLSSATERASTRLACSASWRLIFLSLTWFWILKKQNLNVSDKFDKITEVARAMYALEENLQSVAQHTLQPHPY